MFSTSIRILVVDDMPTIRDLVKTQMKTLGYSQFLEAGNGEEAWKILNDQKSAGSPVELVICDWNMPVLSGLELLKRVRKTPEWAQLPFVLLTSESERDQVTEAILSGVSQYIIKPFSARIFDEKLKHVYTKHFGKK